VPTRYVLSPEARRDIEQIRDYFVEEAGAKVARHVLGQITKALHFLAETPRAGHRRDDLTDEDVRFWTVLSYLIVYDPAMRPIGIARVLHGARDLEAMFRTNPPRA
jgi:plasmid stabilization system protein ParE